MKRLFAGCLLAFLLNACAPNGGTPPPRPGNVDHVVVFWLKRPGNHEDRKKIHDASDQLKAIPGVLSVRHGNVLSSDRDVVDDSFDLACIITFDSVASLRAYDTHPVHAKLAAEVARPLCRKIVVHDVIH